MSYSKTDLKNDGVKIILMLEKEFPDSAVRMAALGVAATVLLLTYPPRQRKIWLDGLLEGIQGLAEHGAQE